MQVSEEKLGITPDYSIRFRPGVAAIQGSGFAKC